MHKEFELATGASSAEESTDIVQTYMIVQTYIGIKTNRIRPNWKSSLEVSQSFNLKLKLSSKDFYFYFRRNESSCRPNTWHSAKSTDDTPKSEPNPVADPTWQTKYDAGWDSEGLCVIDINWTPINIINLLCFVPGHPQKTSPAVGDRPICDKYPASSTLWEIWKV